MLCCVALLSVVFVLARRRNSNGADLEAMGFFVAHEAPPALPSALRWITSVRDLFIKGMMPINALRMDMGTVHKELSETDLRQLSAFSDLDSLSLGDGFVGLPKNWSDYLSSWPKLEYLEICGVNVSASDAIAISKLHKLRVLVLGSHFDEASLMVLSTNITLSYLALFVNPVTRSELDYLRRIPSLRRLQVTCETSDAETAKQVVSIPQVTDLELFFSRSECSVLTNLGTPRSLIWLTMKDMDLDQSALQAISHLPALLYVEITDCRLREADLFCLTNSATLSVLTVSHSGMTLSTKDRWRALRPNCHFEVPWQETNGGFRKAW